MDFAIAEKNRECKAGIIRFNRPDLDNRIGLEAAKEIMAILDSFASDDEVKSVILTGTGMYFCAGGSIDGFPDGYALDQLVYADGTVDLQKALYYFPKPVIAAVNGNAFAGGLTIVEACDLAVASTTSMFGLTELGHGNFPMIALAVNGKVIPKKRLFEMIYFVKPVSANDAVKWNIVNELVPQDNVMEKALSYAATLSERSSIAMRIGRRTYYEMLDMNLDTSMTYAKAALLELCAMEDVKEGMRAKREKRVPEYIGK